MGRLLPPILNISAAALVRKQSMVACRIFVRYAPISKIMVRLGIFRKTHSKPLETFVGLFRGRRLGYPRPRIFAPETE